MVSFDGLGKGGAQSIMMNCVRNMSNSYLFDVLLFTNEVRYYEKEFLSFGGRIIRIPHYCGKNKLKKKLDYYLRGPRLFFNLRKVIKENGPYQVIHCHNGYESALCLFAAKQEKIPIRICHSHTSKPKSNFLATFLNFFYTCLINKSSSHKIGCSESACKALYGNSDFVVLNNPYDESKYIFNDNKQINDVLTLIQVGSFNDNKNQLFSIEILKSLYKKKSDVFLNLVGFGNEKYVRNIKEKVAEFNLEKNVRFLDGNTADIPQLLSSSTFFLFPSKKEGFGITLIEAQAMGLTCFVSDSVPKTTNVGGCIYLSLNDGPEKWASEILKTPYQRKKYDCTQFKSSEFVKQIALLYGGEK